MKKKGTLTKFGLLWAKSQVRPVDWVFHPQPHIILIKILMLKKTLTWKIVKKNNKSFSLHETTFRIYKTILTLGGDPKNDKDDTKIMV